MHTDANRYYEILGVEPGASAKAIRVGFRRLAKQFHPDSPSGNAGAFILLKRAYDVLSDPDQRSAYDRACRPAVAPEPHRWAAPPPPASAQPRSARPRSPAPRGPGPRGRQSRRSGMGFARYVIAFIVMAAISLGAIQAMISWTEAPPSIRVRTVEPSVTTLVSPEPTPAAAAGTNAPGSSKSGFWDPSPAPAAGKN